MEYIERAAEKLLEKASRTFKAVLVTGARQTGKSTTLKKLFPNIRYLSFDDSFLKGQAETDPTTFFDLNEPPLMMDEVQYVKGLFPYIKIECDNRDAKGLFFLSGSRPFELMRDASESLSGRVYVLEFSPLSLREIQKDPFDGYFVPTKEYVLERAKTAMKPRNIWEIIHRGGYPELQDAQIDWGMFYSSYVKTYLERDVRELSAVQDLNDFRAFMIAVAARTGQVLNCANIANEIGKDAKTVTHWISILEASGIIYLLEPYAPSALNRVIKSPKLYFRDTGLAAYLTRWLTPETLANGAMSGAFFETYAVSEILKSYANRGIDYRYCVYYYRGKDRTKRKNGLDIPFESEIDLIIEENGTLYPVEIKKGAFFDASVTSAFTVLDKIPDKKRGMGAVVCTCPEPGRLRENVWAIPVWYI